MSNELLEEDLDGRIVAFLLNEPPPIHGVAFADTTAHMRQVSIGRSVDDDDNTMLALASLYRSKETSSAVSSAASLASLGVSAVHLGVSRRGRAGRGAVPRGESYAADLARKDLARGDVCIIVKHLNVPWGAKLGEKLWYKYGIRLVKTQQDYNNVVKAHIEAQHSRGFLTKVTMLVRLNYVNEAIDGIERRRQIILEDLATVRQRLEDLKSHISESNLLRNCNLMDTHQEGRSAATGAPRRLLKLAAMRVSGLGATSEKRFIAHGSIVQAEWLEELRRILADYGINLCEGGDPRQDEDVDELLREQFDTSWAEMFPALRVKSLLGALQERTGHLQRLADFLEDQAAHGIEVRRMIARRCINLICERGGLVWRCALQLAQNLPETELTETGRSMPEELRGVLSQAWDVVKELEDPRSKPDPKRTPLDKNTCASDNRLSLTRMSTESLILG